MKTLKPFIYVFAICNLTLAYSQEIDVYNLVLCQNDASPTNITVDPNDNLHGFNVTGLFQHCFCEPGTIASDYCYKKIKQLEPKVLRFPSGGESKFINLLGDTEDYAGSSCGYSWSVEPENVNGYGFIPEEIECYLLNTFGCASHAACYPSNPDYTSAYNEWIGSYNFTTKVCTSPTDNSEVCKQTTYDHTPYIDRFITLINQLHTDGIDPEVIYVANIHTASPSYNVSVIDYLIDAGVNVVGVEMGNEEYDARTSTGYLYNSFTGYRNAIKPYIAALRGYDADIKIGVVAAPPGNVKYNGNFIYESAKRSRFNSWNTSLGSNYTFDWPSAGIDAWDANISHIYVEEKFFNTSMNTLYNSYYYNCPDDEITFGDVDHDFDPLSDGSFDLRWDEHEFLFDYDNNGEGLEQFASLYTSNLQLGGANDNKLWVTEYNAKSVTKNLNPACAPAGSKTQVDFLNTYAHASLIFNWIMRNIDIDKIDLPAGSGFEYNTLHNLLGATLAIIQPIDDLDQLDPSPYDATIDAQYFDDEFRLRAAYYPFLYTKIIFNRNLMRVKANAYIEAPGSPPGSSILYLYPYVSPTFDTVYYFFNTNGVGPTTFILEDNPFICNHEGSAWSTQCTTLDNCGYDEELQGYQYKTTKTVNYIDAQNVYSTAGSATLFKENSYYETHTPEFEIYGLSTTFSGDTWVIPDRSIGVIKCPIYDAFPGPGWGYPRLATDPGLPDIIISPNPTAGIVKISYNGRFTGTIVLTNSAGQVVKTRELDFTNSYTDLNMSDLSDGVYYLGINTNNYSGCEKIILSK